MTNKQFKENYDFLFEYQKDTLQRLQGINKHMIGLDMGLGKTYTSLAMMSFRFLNQETPKGLILCQKTKIKDWVEDTQKMFPDYTIIALDPKHKDTRTKAKQEALIEKHQYTKKLIVISAYKTAENRWKYLKHLFAAGVNHEEGIVLWHDANLIYDESQTAKNHESGLGIFAYDLSQVFPYISLLSGDPISKKYEELYNQLRLMGYTYDYKHFMSEYCIQQTTRDGRKSWTKTIGYKKLPELFDILHKTSVLIKTEEVHELPEQHIIDVEMEGNTRAYKNLIKHRVLNDHEFETAAVLQMAARQMASGFVRDVHGISDHKLNKLEDIINSTDQSLVIWHNFNQERDSIKELAKKLKLDVYEINGTKNQYEEIKKLGLDIDRHIILVNYQAGAKGINLQRYNQTVYYSPTWSGENYKQSKKRTHRVGQKNACHYYRFITKKTLERDIYDSVEKGEDYTATMFAHTYGLDIEEE